MRIRVYYLVAVLTAIGLGISSRSFSDYLPLLVSKHFGDALWASMVYFGVRGVWPAKKPAFAVCFSFIFCFGIECSQLYQAAWINYIRNTLVGSLILGKGFLFADLLRYSAGIVCSFLAECMMSSARKWRARDQACRKFNVKYLENERERE
ncbi:DUF2809 domain-containing protein [Paenibacillus sp. SI8]|uniref:ribosomal maturation YjgA family protein n=1 Tax=unclassified Paenibacillus TaxID=185978 RepID=UPI003467AF74